MQTSMIHASPTGAIRPPSVRRCPRVATNASAPWDEKGDTARKVMWSNTGLEGHQSVHKSRLMGVLVRL